MRALVLLTLLAGCDNTCTIDGHTTGGACPTPVVRATYTAFADEAKPPYAPHPTAVGGIQRVQLDPTWTERFRVSIKEEPWDDGDTGDNFEVLAVEDHAITIAGVSPGNDWIGMMDPDGGDEVGEIPYGVFAGTVGAIALSPDPAVYALLPGTPVVVQLLDSATGRGRFVDEAMQLDGGASFVRTAWDAMRIADTAEPGAKSIAVAAARLTATLGVQVATVATDIATPTQRVFFEQDTWVCFAAYAGDREIYRAGATVVVDTQVEATVDPQFPCARVRVPEGGPSSVSFTVTSRGLTKSIAVPVTWPQ